MKLNTEYDPLHEQLDKVAPIYRMSRDFLTIPRIGTDLLLSSLFHDTSSSLVEVLAWLFLAVSFHLSNHIQDCL